MGNKILRLREVIDMTGLSRATLYKMIAVGEFPAQRQLGKRSVGWRSSDLQDWLNNLSPSRIGERQKIFIYKGGKRV